jgi:hypothetical protein
MLGGARDARRTERYVDDLLAAGERGADDAPVDAGLDPTVLAAARRLRAGLIRVHPSFRFEEKLAGRLAAGAVRMAAGLDPSGPSTPPDNLAPFPVLPVAELGPAADGAELPAGFIAPHGTAAPEIHGRAILPPAVFRRLPEVAARPSRPFIVGGVGVASAAISLGAVYVAWRHSRPSPGRMGKAVRAAHGRAALSSRNRRSGVTHGILGV